jgi:hypothetical protein
MTNRLTYEFKSRKALLTKVSELKQKRKATADLVEAKRKALENLGSTVTSIEKVELVHTRVSALLISLMQTAAPAQAAFGLQLTARAKNYSLAQHLPAPLYLLFNHLQACVYSFESYLTGDTSHHEIFDKDIEVTVSGSAEAAVAFRAEHTRLTTSTSRPRICSNAGVADIPSS